MVAYLVKNPTKGELYDRLRASARAAHYSTSGRSAWVMPRPFDRIAAANSIHPRAADGHWEQIGSRRRLALAWWTAADQSRWVRVIGDADWHYTHDRTKRPSVFASATSNHMRVFNDLGMMLQELHLRRIFDALPPEWHNAIVNDPNDLAIWLMLADDLADRGVDVTPIRIAFDYSTGA